MTQLPFKVMSVVYEVKHPECFCSESPVESDTPHTGRCPQETPLWGKCATKQVLNRWVWFWLLHPVQGPGPVQVFPPFAAALKWNRPFLEAKNETLFKLECKVKR